MSNKEFAEKTESSKLPSEQFEPLLTLKQVAVVLGLSERSVRRIIRAGDLPAIRIGGSPRIRSADLRAYLDGAPAYYPGEGEEE